jgi:hypothetical protein
MLSELTRQLYDPDPNIRRAAIIALGKTKSADALRPLAEVVLKDSDPELRELARKAGIYIRRELNVEPEPQAPRRRRPAAEPAPEPQLPGERRRGAVFLEPEADDRRAPAKDADEELPPGVGARPVRGKKYAVPKESRDRARQYTEAALNDSLNNRRDRAMKNLTEALSLDPNLINDDYYNNVAASVTGLPAFEAIESIINPQTRIRFIGAAKEEVKQARIDMHMEQVRQTNTTDLAFELVLYALILFLGPLLVGIVGLQAFGGFLETVLATNVANPDLPRLDPEIVRLAETVRATSLASLLPPALGSAAVGVISLVVQMGIVHVLATAVFSGHATYVHALTTVLRFYNRWVPILFAVMGFSVLIAAFAGASPVLLCPAVILFGAGMFVLFRTAGKIGEAYGFGAGIGCFALILSGIVLGLLNLAISAFVFQATGVALDALFDPALLPNLALPPS